MRTITFWTKVLSAGLVFAVVMAAGAGAATLNTFKPADLCDNVNVARMPTSDARDAVTLYLGPRCQPAVLTAELLAAGPPATATLAVYEAPRPPDEAPAEAQPPARLASFAYPEVLGLAGSESDERAIPFSSTAVLSMGPGGFGRVMTGRSPGAIADWVYAAETAMSYVRPHVNMQMMLALEMPGTPPAEDFEGPGMAPHAYFAVDHITRVDSADLGVSTEGFGGRSARTPVDEPHTGMAVGLDLGLLPTFLSQMGVNVSVVASRGRQTGSVTLALVGTAELPVDWAPHERPYHHPTGFSAEQLAQEAARQGEYPFGGISRPRGIPGAGPSQKPLTPITPQVPEPATLGLAGLGAAALLQLRRRLKDS
jgi:hypothetical protein